MEEKKKFIIDKKIFIYVGTIILTLIIGIIIGLSLMNKGNKPVISKDCDPISGGGYNVSFVTNSDDKLDSVHVCIACPPDSYEKVPVLEKEGYKFDGWYYDKKLTKKVEATSFVDVTPSPKLDKNACLIGYNDITLYAKWISEKEDNKEETTQKQTISSNNSSSSSKEVKSDKYFCRSGGTLILNEGKYTCVEKTSGSTTYYSAMQYHCDQEGFTLVGNQCYAKHIVDAQTVHKCPNDNYILVPDSIECILVNNGSYNATFNGITPVCASGFHYVESSGTCLPDNDASCPSGNYIGEDGRCYAEAIFVKYTCDFIKSDKVTLDKDKCIWEIYRDASLY